MEFSRVIHTVDSHTGGNPTRVIVSGMPAIPGRTLLERRDHLRRNDDWLRRLLVHEPRASGLMCAVLLTPPGDPEADVGAIFLEQDEYPPMCGHCIIGVATTLVELGLVPRQAPVTRIGIETPAGLVRTSVSSEAGHVTSVTFLNVPSFVVDPNAIITLADGQALPAVISYGGEFYVCVDAGTAGVEVSPANADVIVSRANVIRRAVSERKLRHPTRPDLNRVYNVMFYERGSSDPVSYKNVVVVPPGKIDRSPCGTGTSALLAHLIATGELREAAEFTNAGILGTSFKGRVHDQLMLGDTAAIVPEITGSAYLTGFHEFVLDPQDPFPRGFLLTGDR